jgi:hypothetical protein
MFIIIVIIFGFINSILTLFNYNLIEIISNNINKILNTNQPFDKLFYIIIIVSVIYIIINPDILLVFLCKTQDLFKSLSYNIIPLKKINISIRTLPNSKIELWFNKNKDEIKNTKYILTIEKDGYIKKLDELKNSKYILTSDKDGYINIPILDNNIIKSENDGILNIYYKVIDKNISGYIMHKF